VKEEKKLFHIHAVFKKVEFRSWQRLAGVLESLKTAKIKGRGHGNLGSKTRLKALENRKKRKVHRTRKARSCSSFFCASMFYAQTQTRHRQIERERGVFSSSLLMFLVSINSKLS